MSANRRPARLRITGELGARQSLPEGEDAFDRLPGGPDGSGALVLGLGPDPSLTVELLGDHTDIIYTEHDDFIVQADAQTHGEWSAAVPATWRRIDPAELTDAELRRREVLVYAHGQRLFPSFWGPLAARARWVRIAGDAGSPVVDEVWMPAGEADLLVRELEAAFAVQSLPVRTLPADRLSTDLPRLLKHSRPRFFFSINFKGFDPLGEIASLLHAADVATAVWCVDNPFHLLTAQRSTAWRDVALFVTDDWFIEPLRNHGAKTVHHLPLATDPALFTPATSHPDLAERLLFVGRSSFPREEKFFAAARLPGDAMVEAAGVIEAAGRPDFAWWVERLHLHPLWPGQEVRAAGLGAQRSGELLRSRILGHATAQHALTIVGDDRWREFLDDIEDLRPPVDYYGPLAGMYRSAWAVLGATSLVMPSGLTQRHFDVWAAGGCLLSDASPGLGLFPDELTAEIRYRDPAGLSALVGRLASEPALKADLIAAWRELILAEHTYAHRVRTILDALV
jgi:hypothetical protein